MASAARDAQPATRAASDGVAAPTPSDAPARRYSPWRGLVPRYWLPIIEDTDDGRTAFGAYTSSSDVVGRHEYGAQLTVPSGRAGEVAASVDYRYAGLGMPLLDLSLSQFWDHDPIVSGTAPYPVLGQLTRRTREAALAATVVRPRVRSYAAASAGVAYEMRDYATDPAPLLGRLFGAEYYASKPDLPSLFASASWSNARRPTLSVSPEDGVALSASARDRWLRDGGASDHARTVVGVARAYKSLDLPGYAHHVLAARLAGGAASAAADELEAGGTSGSTIELLPGLALGDTPHAFGVRGFPTDAVEGRRVVGGSLEYRAPLTLPARGFGLFPLFLGRTSASAFVEGASAWCPASIAATCVSRTDARRTIASAGAELALDAALQYDVPYRFRAGLATPVAGREWFGKRSVTGYVTLGLSF